MSEPVYAEQGVTTYYRGFSARASAAAASIFTVTQGRRARLRSIYAVGTSGEAIISLFDAASGLAYGSGTGIPVFEFPLKAAQTANTNSTSGVATDNIADFAIGDYQLRGVEFYSSIVGFIRIGGLGGLSAANYSGGPFVSIGVLEY